MMCHVSIDIRFVERIRDPGPKGDSEKGRGEGRKGERGGGEKEKKRERKEKKKHLFCVSKTGKPPAKLSTKSPFPSTVSAVGSEGIVRLKKKNEKKEKKKKIQI